jgi:hypothetical protein
MGGDKILSVQNKAQRRLRAFRLHLLCYAVVAAALVALNLALDPARVWFVWPMVGWGGILAIHAAYVMGLFDRAGGSEP